jgi:hypothetical protein
VERGVMRRKKKKSGRMGKDLFLRDLVFIQRMDKHRHLSLRWDLILAWDERGSIFSELSRVNSDA